MFTDLENTTEIYVQFNSPLLFFSKSGSKLIDEICVSSNLNFFIHTTNQVDAKKLNVLS